MTTSYAICWHQDGHGVRTVESNLTREQAEQWLAEKSAEVGQPVLTDLVVNESDALNCGYYYAEELK